MENKNELEQFLRDKMSVGELNMQEPDPALVSRARKITGSRKKPANEIEDFFSLVAAFLNFRIKLYHAVIATIVVGGIILYVTRDEQTNKNESHTDGYVSNIASVRSSTVLSSIYTFGLNKKQYDGRTSN